MTGIQPTMRRTRFVCISDTHNASPPGAFRLPKGDVLLHAGDMTNQGSLSELQKTVKWLENADFEVKIVVAGNHDITLDSDFYDQHGRHFHNQEPQDASKCQELLANSPSILWLKHGSAVVDLQSPMGPRTTFKIFGSPYSPAKGTWAFGYGTDEAAHIWDEIPPDADIVITHTPPKYHCDEARDHQAAGCPALRDALRRTQPRIAICGHVHEGRGVEFVQWGVAASSGEYGKESTTKWEDPGRDNKKISLVDLTVGGPGAVQKTSSLCHRNEVDDSISKRLGPVISPESLGRGDSSGQSKSSAMEPLSLAVPDQQGTSHGCDVGSLYGGLGPRQTCVVNAAIIASSWPHGPGGKKFNKPIVVDIDLPALEK